MLVISRRVGEVTMVETPSGWLEVVLVSQQRGKVRLGFRGDVDKFKVWRRELLSPETVQKIYGAMPLGE